MKTMDTWSYYYGIVKKLSLFTGMWPYLEPRTRLFRVLLLTMIVCTIFVPQIAHQLTCKQDLQCIFESMTSCLLTSVSMVKVWAFQLNIRKVCDTRDRVVSFAKIAHLHESIFDKCFLGFFSIKGFTEHLFVDWKELEIPREYEIMKSYAENCRRFSILYPVYCLSAVALFMSVSMIPPILDIVLPLNESRPVLLPYPGYYFVDSRKYFYYIYGHSIVSWEVIMAGLIAHDCMFVSYVEHICSMFAVVGSRFEYLFPNLNDAVGDVKENLDDTYRKRIALFVHTHRKTLEFAHLLENTFTVPFALQLIIIVVTMSCTLLQITQQKASVLELIRYVFYVIGQLFHLFCLSFEGQKLIDHSLRMRDKIYNSSWYEAPLKSRKLLILTMIQSLRPTSLSAGKVYVFSLESFTTVLQTSMSYFTVLSSFQ